MSSNPDTNWLVQPLVTALYIFNAIHLQILKTKFLQNLPICFIFISLVYNNHSTPKVCGLKLARYLLV